LKTGARRPRKIAVSRQGWTNSINLRRLVNARRIEHLLAEQGFDIVRPHELSLAEQRNVFHHADVVVGEDGSAMHNTIFCRPGTRIGLIAMGRINYIHLLTARALGHRVTFIPSEPAEDHEANWFLEMYRLRPRVLNQSLEELLGERARP
jgi:capsular polysaccharide biosynthesis protein